jgi:hypothetical protein
MCVACLQAQEQLLLELELNVVASQWRHRHMQQHVLLGWHTTAAAAVQEREQQARLQETFSKVQGWLTDMKGGGHSAAVASAVAGSRGCVAPAQAAAPLVAAAAVGGPAMLKQLPPWRDWDPDSDTDADY